MARHSTPNPRVHPPIKRVQQALGYAQELFLGDLFLNITGVLIVALGITLFAMKTQRYEQAIIDSTPLSFLVCSDFIEARSNGEKIKPSLLMGSHFAETLLGQNKANHPIVFFLGEEGNTAAFFLSAYLAKRGLSDARILEGQCPAPQPSLDE